MAGPIDEFCEGLRSELHAAKLKTQSDLETLRQLLGELELSRQAELVAAFAAQRGLRAPPSKGVSSTAVAQKLLAALQGLPELTQSPSPRPPSNPEQPQETAAAPPRSAPPPPTHWPELMKWCERVPVVVVGGSPRPDKLNEALGALSSKVEWIETSRQGTHAIGNLAQRIRQRRVGALIVLDAAVGHKHSEPLLAAAREAKIPTTYAHKGGATAVARAFTQLEKMVGAR